jgi:hypothetical protein
MRSSTCRVARVALGLAAAQVVDAVGGGVAPRDLVQSHLDHLGVPAALRPALGVIKVSASVGLVAGLRWPRVGVVTSAALVSYYSAAATFHVLSGDHPALAAPAAGFGATAAVVLMRLYLPATSERGAQKAAPEYAAHSA